MFIYSFRAGTLKFFGIVCIALACVIALIAFVPTYAARSDGSFKSASASPDNTVSINYDKIKSAEDAANFLAQFGWAVNISGVKKADVTIPQDFDKVFAGYNELQKEQGLDLSKFRKKNVTRYTFEVTNYPNYDGKVYANVLVYRNKVIGGDICSADVSGFIHGFQKQS